MTDRPRREGKRIIRILKFIWLNEPTTQRAIADHIAGTDADTCRSNLYVDLELLDKEGVIKFDRTTKIVSAARPPFPHRGGVDVFVSEPWGK